MLYPILINSQLPGLGRGWGDDVCFPQSESHVQAKLKSTKCATLNQQHQCHLGTWQNKGISP